MTLGEFRRATGISQALAERWYPHVAAAMREFDIATPSRKAAFLAQIGHESNGFSSLAESFNYSVNGLKATFGSRLTVAQCEALGRQPGERSVPLARQQKIANLVYGGRFGNSSTQGWFYRGHGLKQITFHDNYAECGQALGVDLLTNPDLLLTEALAARSAGWYWKSRGCNELADKDDFALITKRINGGYNGLQDRMVRWERAKDVLFAAPAST